MRRDLRYHAGRVALAWQLTKPRSVGDHRARTTAQLRDTRGDVSHHHPRSARPADEATARSGVPRLLLRDPRGLDRGRSAEADRFSLLRRGFVGLCADAPRGRDDLDRTRDPSDPSPKYWRSRFFSRLRLAHPSRLMRSFADLLQLCGSSAEGAFRRSSVLPLSVAPNASSCPTRFDSRIDDRVLGRLLARQEIEIVLPRRADRASTETSRALMRCSISTTSLGFTSTGADQLRRISKPPFDPLLSLCRLRNRRPGPAVVADLHHPEVVHQVAMMYARTHHPA